MSTGNIYVVEDPETIQELKLKDVLRIKLAADEVLVVEMEKDSDISKLKAVGSFLHKCFPNNKVMISDPTTRFYVISQEKALEVAKNLEEVFEPCEDKEGDFADSGDEK